MNLGELANIVQGSIYTRIKPNSDIDECTLLDTISMQELNSTIGYSNSYEYLGSKVLNSKLKNCVFTKEFDVVIGLTMQKAMVISKERADKLLLSNFALIQINDTSILDPFYLCWLINESVSFRKKLTMNTQGSAWVTSLSSIRELEIPLIEIGKQRKIGKLYTMTTNKYKLDKLIADKKEILMKKQIEIIYKGEN